MPFPDLRQWEFNPIYKRLPQVFDAEACAKIIKLKEGREPMVSEMRVDGRDYRSSDLYWLTPEDDTAWIVERLREVILAFNTETFQFEIDGCQDLQLTGYGVGQLYDWHADLSSKGTSRRKLSFSVLLSKLAQFEGGDIQFFESDSLRPSIGLNQGDGVVFPSWYKHRVVPVARGHRWSLVSWWTGPPFR